MHLKWLHFNHLQHSTRATHFKILPKECASYNYQNNY